MDKRLTQDQFQVAAAGLPMGQKNIDIARAILVEGRRQSELAREYGLTKGAVSQAVTRVWEVSQVPVGYERVSAVLPDFQAFQVRQWAAAAAKREPHRMKLRTKTVTKA